MSDVPSYLQYIPPAASPSPTPAATEAAGKISDARFHRVTPPKPGRIDPADTSARRACHLDVMPLSQIADRDFVALMLEDDDVVIHAKANRCAR